MIIWNGFGFLVLVFIMGSLLVSQFITNSITKGETYWNEHQWPRIAALIVAAMLCWYIGKFLEKRQTRELVDIETGEEIIQKPYHALFFIKMHWWGPVLVVLAIVIIIADMVK